MSNPELPVVSFDAAGDAVGRWWTAEQDGRVACHLCPRECRLKDGDRGFCFVRANRGGKMILDTYGRSTGFCIDPIEKKPLNHFFPGTPVLSFGTAGCNLGCKFCQNWSISKSRETARLSDHAAPHEIAHAAANARCHSVAFTYNDPVIWAEYAIDTAAQCRAVGVKTVAVTAGFLTDEARGPFFSAMDAANIDLKAFTEEFYFKLTLSHLQPVLDSIRYAVNETECWVELTNLIIPDANDDTDQLRQMCDWIVDSIGDQVPIHFTAFHPDFRLRDRPRTDHDRLIAAYDIARSAGLKYVYVGNVHDVTRQSTYCPSCQRLLIERDWHQLGRYTMTGNRCGHCGETIAGRFQVEPGHWGRRRQPIRINGIPRQPFDSSAFDSSGFDSSATKSTDEASQSNPDIDPSSQSHVDSNSPRSVSTVAVKAANMSSTIPNRPSQTVTDLRARFDSDALAVIRRAAGHVVERVVTGGQIDPGPILGALADEPIHGIYVTLKRGHTLRGCCGLQGPAVPLQTALIDAASRTATQDPRMPPIAPVELPYLNLAVSILGPPFPIGAAGDDRIAAVHVGRHGLRIRSGNQVGLLLPSVAVERNWDARQFLDAVCHKAGLPPGTWRRDDVQLELFDGVDQDGPLLAHNPTSTEESSRYGDVAKFDKQQIDRIVHWVRHNLAAFQCGATPLYYATDVDDATVQGVVLRIQHDPQQPPANWMQLTLRDGIPLQSTLYQITQTAIETLAGAGHPNDWQIDVAILSTIVHHGSDAEYDLQGIDSNTRGIIATDGRHWGFGYDRQADLESTRTRTMQMQRFRRGMTQIYSAVCDTSADELSIGIGPRADSVIRMRPPGVAGTFYPADDQTREEMVDQLIEGLEQQARRPVHAAMVPHAGLRFSGRIAAEVWSRIALPDTVLIIGPKHTADGVDWAVAPHDQWFLSPTAQMKGNVELAQRIADRVPGMELDAAAHAREHGIEVQLPLLYRMAPETQITAIAMSAGDFEELEQAAEHLANCLAELEQPPLLIISSDMNHFADDQENRRRDRLALDAMATLDARKLLDVCSRENISMCGQIPAALVMLTLQKLNQPLSYQEIAYGTSADTTGDRSRVVGYAGVLL